MDPVCPAAQGRSANEVVGWGTSFLNGYKWWKELALLSHLVDQKYLWTSTGISKKVWEETPRKSRCFLLVSSEWKVSYLHYKHYLRIKWNLNEVTNKRRENLSLLMGKFDQNCEVSRHPFCRNAELPFGAGQKKPQLNQKAAFSPRQVEPGSCPGWRWCASQLLLC